MQSVQDLLPYQSARITVRGQRDAFTIYYLARCPEVLYILLPLTREGSVAVYMHRSSSCFMVPAKDGRWYSKTGENNVERVTVAAEGCLSLSYETQKS